MTDTTEEAAFSKRVLRVLYAAGFVTAFGAHAVAANLGRYALGHRTSLIELGVLLALYDGAEVVLKPVFGALSDRIGPRPVLIGGLIGFALASAGFVLAQQPNWLGAARFSQGVAAAAFSPAASVLVSAAGGTKRTGRAFGGYGGAKGLGYLAGPVGGGALIAAGGYPVLFSFLAVLAVAVALVAWVLVPTVEPVPRQRETLVDLGRRIGQAQFVVPVLVLAGATAALSAGIGFLPVVGERAHLGALATGSIVSLLALTAALLQPRAGATFDARRRSAMLIATSALATTGIGFVVAAFLRGPIGLVIAAILIGAGVGIATPLAFATLAHTAPSGRMGQTMGAAEVGRELGDAGGPLLVGALAAVSLTVGLAGLAAALGVISLAILPSARHAADETDYSGRAAQGREAPLSPE